MKNREERVSTRQGKLLGPIENISTPRSRTACTQAATYINQAVQIKFKNVAESVVLNRQHFDWKESSFCFHFQQASRALTFIEVWESLTEYDLDLGYCVLTSEISQPNSSPVVCQLSSENSLSDELMIEEMDSLREREDVDERPPQAKKPKHSDSMDDDIFSKKIGTTELLLSNLVEPHTSRCLRTIDEVFVDCLAKKLEEDPSAPGVPPVAVLCVSVVSVDDFSLKRKDAYKYELLGGQHTALARKSVSKKNPGNSHFQQVLSEVYVGLTDDEALRLASRHNSNGHFVHKMTHRDHLEACRSKLYTMKGIGPEEEIPLPTPEWKDICRRCILPRDMGRCTYINIFNQACFRNEIWVLACQIMDKFEKGELKNQATPSKCASKPDFKQQHFSCIQCLPDEFKVEVLSEVKDKVLSLAELKDKAAKYRDTKFVQRAFCKITDTTLVAALRRFPLHSAPERLEKFLFIASQKSIPKSFQAYCESALTAENLASGQCNLDSHQLGCCRAIVIKGNICDSSCQHIRKAYPLFMGAGMFLTDISEECTEEDILKIVYSTKQVNTIPEKSRTTYNVVLVARCISKAGVLSSALKKCYDNVSICYWEHVTKSTDQTKSVGFTNSTGCVVIGHYSINDKVEKYHFNFENGTRSNFFRPAIDDGPASAGIPTGVLQRLIETLSFEGDWIIDATRESGNCAVACLKAKRNVISIQNDLAPVRAQLNAICK